MWSTRNASQLHSPQPDRAARDSRRRTEQPSRRPSLADRELRRRVILAAAVAAALTLAGGPRALAQTNGSASRGDSHKLQEIIVTAEFSRRTQLQSTPIAITAITAHDLVQRGMTNLGEIGKGQLAPNVNIQSTSAAFGPTLSIFIRGIGQGDFDPATEPGVALYVNGVYFGQTQASNLSVLDLSRVEILRGPQGTLSGTNSEGGAINLVTKTPTGSNTGYLQATTGNYNRLDFHGYYDLALSKANGLSMALSAFHHRIDGYVNVVDYACAHPDLGASQGYPVNTAAPQLLSAQFRQGGCSLGHEGGQDDTGARLAIRWAPPDLPLEVNLAGGSVQNDDQAIPDELIHWTNAGTNLPGAAPSPLLLGMNNYFTSQYGVPMDNRFVPTNIYTTYGTFEDLNRQTIPMQSRINNNDDLEFSVDWSILPNMHLRSLTGWRHFVSSFSTDQDESPLPDASATDGLLYDQFSQEEDLTGHVDAPLPFIGRKRLDWAAGVYFLHIDDTLLDRVFLTEFNLFLLSRNPEVLNSKAAFTQFTLHATSKLSITAGLRYTLFRKRFTFVNTTPMNNGAPVINPATAFPYLFFLCGPQPTPCGFANSLPSGVPISAVAKNEFGDWKAGWSYQFTPDLMTYFTAATGHKGGGVNPRPFTQFQVVPFNQEKVVSYELGVKSEWFNHRVRLNADVFHMHYTDLQANSNRLDAQGNPFTGIFNVGAARIDGAEVELDARPFRGLLFQGSAGYQNFKYLDLGTAIGCQDPSVTTPVPGINCVVGGPGLSDKPVGTPEFNASVGVQYSIDMGDRGSLTPRLDASYRGFEYGSVINMQHNFYANQPALTLLNAHLTWADPIPNWTTTLSVTNLANHQYFVARFDLTPFSEGSITGMPGQPREYELTFRRDFGGG